MERAGEAVINRLDRLIELQQKSYLHQQRWHEELLERLAHSPEGSEHLLREIINNLSPLYAVLMRMETGIEISLAIDLAPQAMRAKLKDVTSEEAMRVVREFLMSGDERAQRTRQRAEGERQQAQKGARR